jgi:hypothetical protein
LKAFTMPAGTGSRIIRPMTEEELLNDEEQAKFRSGVGMALYLIKYSRPDIANSVRELSKVMDGANKAHRKALMQLIKYVVETKEQKLTYNVSKKKEKMEIKGYGDSDFAGNTEDCKSINGEVIYLLECPIAWKSKGQKGVTLSSTEAEYVAASEVTMDVLFAKQILEFCKEMIEYPIIIKVDNIGAIYLANNAGGGNRTKHVDTRFHFVRNLIQKGTIKMEFVRSEDNDADVMTKNLGEREYKKHIGKIMGIHAAK